MENKKQENKINRTLWKNIAYIAGAFSLIICILLIVNYIQINRADPVNTEIINKLVERLSDNPEDAELRQEIRQLDLLARKAYFTNQWQIRTGGYLLLVGIAVLIIALQVLEKSKKISPVVTDGNSETLITERKKARQWISIGGTLVILAALVAAFLSHNELKTTIAGAPTGNDSTKSGKASSSETEEIAETPAPQETEPVHSIQTKPDTTKVAVAQAEDTTSGQEEKETLSDIPSYKEIIKNFPCFRGPGGNSIASHKNIPLSWNGNTGKNIQWKVKIPLKGFNSPIVWGDKVFLTGSNGQKQQVYCYDRHNGKNLWTRTVDNVPGAPAKKPDVTSNTGHAAPTMATDGRRVYAIFSNGNLVCYDMDGKRIWAKNIGLPGNHYGHSSSLMVHQNILIVQFDERKSPRVMGMDVKTGKTIWTTKRDVKISWASPVVAYTGKQTEVFLIADPYVASHNPYTGKENWKIDCTYGEVGPSVAYADSIVFACNEYAKLVAIKIGDKPEIIWENDELLSDVPSPVATDKLMFLATSYGVVVCYDAKTGEKYWEKEFNNGFYSSPMLVNGKIFLTDRQGITHIFAADKQYKAIGSNPLGEKSDCTPAFVDGNIYLRGTDHLFCIGK